MFQQLSDAVPSTTLVQKMVLNHDQNVACSCVLIWPHLQKLPVITGRVGGKS